MAADEDDAWLEQLREALASSSEDEPMGDRSRFSFAGEEPQRVTEPETPAMAPATPTRPDQAASDEHRVGLAGIRDALRVLSVRISAVESLAEDISRQSRRGAAAPSAAEIEQIVTRALRTVLPEVLEEFRRQGRSG